MEEDGRKVSVLSQVLLRRDRSTLTPVTGLFKPVRWFLSETCLSSHAMSTRAVKQQLTALLRGLDTPSKKKKVQTGKTNDNNDSWRTVDRILYSYPVPPLQERKKRINKALLQEALTDPVLSRRRALEANTKYVTATVKRSDKQRVRKKRACHHGGMIDQPRTHSSPLLTTPHHALHLSVLLSVM